MRKKQRLTAFLMRAGVQIADLAPDESDARTVRIRMGDGTELSIELFESDQYRAGIMIRVLPTAGAVEMAVAPISGNAIRISGRRP